MIILREEMSYNRDNCNSATKRTSSNGKMEVLYMNLLREYFELECESFKKEFQHPFDIENYIDDFVVLSFFIGNMFISWILGHLSGRKLRIKFGKISLIKYFLLKRFNKLKD